MLAYEWLREWGSDLVLAGPHQTQAVACSASDVAYDCAYICVWNGFRLEQAPG